MMSTDLFSNKQPQGAPPSQTNKRRLPIWLLPLGLALSFTAVLFFAFADRLLPAKQVRVSPAVLLTDIAAKKTDSLQEPTDPTIVYDAPMRFQAAGWFEPDPLPIRATALTDGVVDQVHVLEGESVRKNQALANLIAEDAQLALDASQKKLEQTTAEHHMHLATIPAINAEAESVTNKIASAKALLAELSDKLSRLGRLSKGTVSDHERTAARLATDAQVAKIASLKSDHASVLARLEAINTQSKVFDAMIAAARIKVSKANLALSRTRITSPVDGIVLELKAAPGQKKLLRMDDPDSATIAVLYETGKLQARVDVPLADARALAPGQAAIITSDFLPNATFKGVVSRIAGTADLQRNTLQAKVRVIKPDPRLRPEMLCRVKFLEPSNSLASGQTRTASGNSRSVMAPLDALFDRQNARAATYVVTPDGTHAEHRQLELGRLQRDGYLEIRSGLLAGESLILPPHDGLEDGRRIKISASSP